MAQTPETAEPLKLTAENHEENWDFVCLHDGTDWFLYYYGFFRPLFREYTLPELYEGKIRIPMGAKQYMAVRMKAVE